MIDIYSNEIISKLEAMEYQIKHQMKLYYLSKIENFNEKIFSQQKPMKNLIENENNRKLFFSLKEKYFNYLKQFNEPLDK